MLDSTHPVSPTPAQVNLDGRKLGRLLRCMTAPRRALLAYQVETGAVTVQGLPRAQSARLCRVARGYVGTVAKLDPATREKVRAAPFLLTGIHQKRIMSDSGVDALVDKIGLERVLASLDRLTTPKAVAAE